jgi:hypothetical protein
MTIRNRIKELRMIKGSDLAPNPKNWRTHPHKQKDALKDILKEVGFSGAVIARELDNGKYELIDGHLRAETSLSQEIPVLVVDLTEAEADKVLATHDPLGAMAGTDYKKAEELFASITTDSEALAAMMQEMLGDQTALGEDKPDGLTLAKLTIGGYETRHNVAMGERWEILGKHCLLVNSVINDWPTWIPVLREMGENTMFAPYAGPLALISSAAQVRPICIVQPVQYVANLILDWAEDTYGTESIVKVGE